MRRGWSTTRAWTLAVAASLALVGCADGAVGPSTALAGHRVIHALAAPVKHPTAIGVGNVAGCMTGSSSGLPVLRTYHATVVRVVIDPRHGVNGQAAPCLRAAVAAGYKVHVAISYFNAWSTPATVAYFKHVLRSYARYAWAISIGNEQELNQGGAKDTGAAYARVWRAVEPVVARVAPRGIRLAGGIS